MRYRADITAGSLKIPESRVIADLLLQGADKPAWDSAVFTENRLQARNPATARRLARLIRNRLEPMGTELWLLVRDGTSIVAAQAGIAAAIRQSPLLGDFMDLVVREQYRMFSPVLPLTVWETYIQDCHGRDPDMPAWHAATQRRLRSSVYQMLAQAGYLDNTRNRHLQTVHVDRGVLACLRSQNETNVLRCMEICP